MCMSQVSHGVLGVFAMSLPMLGSAQLSFLHPAPGFGASLREKLLTFCVVGNRDPWDHCAMAQGTVF